MSRLPDAPVATRDGRRSRVGPVIAMLSSTSGGEVAAARLKPFVACARRNVATFTRWSTKSRVRGSELAQGSPRSKPRTRGATPLLLAPPMPPHAPQKMTTPKMTATGRWPCS